MSDSPRVQELLDLWGDAHDEGREIPLDELCAADPELRPEVEKIVAFRKSVGALMAGAAAVGMDTASAVELGDTSGLIARATDSDAGEPTPIVSGYDILGFVAAGGMGSVWRARHKVLGRVVALKVIRPDRLTPDLVKRFRVEAQAVARLEHPNVVIIHDVGEYRASSGRSAPFVALQFVDGRTLEDVAGTTPMDPAEAARVVACLARGMAHVHARNVIHRDLKPGNVLMGPAEEPGGPRVPKITDFGLARNDGESAPDLQTAAGAVMGTVAYMSPEQAGGERLGSPTDVYSLGAILYRLLTGANAHAGKTQFEMLARIRTGPAPSPRAAVPSVPAGLDAICLRCMSLNPEDRPTAAQLALMLERPDAVRPPRGPFPWRRYALAAAALLVVAAAAWGLWPRGKEGPPIFPGPGEKPPVELRGSIDLRVTRPGEQTAKLAHPAARPLRAGDEIVGEVTLSRPAYCYIVWVGTSGEVTLMYPWIDGDVGRRHPEQKTDKLRLPVPVDGRDVVVMVNGPSGLETMALLCRDEPLPEGVDLRKEFGVLPDVRHEVRVPGAERIVAWYENGRVVLGDPDRAPNPVAQQEKNPVGRVNSAIHERARKAGFAYTRTITYYFRGDD